MEVGLGLARCIPSRRSGVLGNDARGVLGFLAAWIVLQVPVAEAGRIGETVAGLEVPDFAGKSRAVLLGGVRT